MRTVVVEVNNPFKLFKNNGEWEFLETVRGQPVLLVDKLDVGGIYFFMVRSKNEIGYSAFSEMSDKIATNPIPIPGIPVQKSNGIGWVELEWALPVGKLLVDSYEVQKRLRSEDELQVEDWDSVTTSVAKNQLLVQELKPCATYEFRVRALTFDGWSSFSPISTFYVTRRRH